MNKFRKFMFDLFGPNISIVIVFFSNSIVFLLVSNSMTTMLFSIIFKVISVLMAICAIGALTKSLKAKEKERTDN